MFLCRAPCHVSSHHAGSSSGLSHIHRIFSHTFKPNRLVKVPVCFYGNHEGGSDLWNHAVPQQTQVLICGAGTVGNSVAYHLVKNGWTDVVVLEQGRIGCGVSWRACGIVGHFHSSAVGALTQYSAKLYKEIQNQGYDIGWKTCGAVNVARTKNRFISLQRLAAEERVQKVDCQVVGPSELKSLHPLIRTDDLMGGVWVATDGIVNPLAVCTTLARLAQSQGAQYIENCQVHKILTENGRVVGAKTSNGPIKCEIFVLAAGMWSRELANTCVPRFRLPIHPAEHQYAVTEVKPALTESLPIVRDYDGQIYCREHQGGLLFGGFEKEGKPLFHKGVPPKFEFQKLPADVVHFQPLCDQAKYRLPILETAHIKEIVNGPETFTPDGKFILGETPEVEGLYVVVGMNGNTVQAAGGVGRALADWITNAEPEAQLLPFDVRRFIDLHNNQKFLRERMREAVGQHYALAHPLPIEFHSARKLRCSPLYTLQEAAGAVFGERMGFERALYFAPEKPKEERLCPPELTFGKPAWFDNVREEYLACRERVGLIDMSSFSKFHIKSAGTEVVDFLQLLCSNDIDIAVGSVTQTGMQNERGGYENDCLLIRRTENCYFMVSPTAQETRINQWMQKRLPSDGSVALSDVTSMYTVLNVVGPKSKELMTELTQSDMNMPAFTSQTLHVGHISGVLVMGFNNTGEPGYSLYIPSEYALHVYNRLVTVGKDFGIKDVGYYTLRFLRIEKFIPFWGEELDSNTTPFEVNRGFKVKMQKEYFLGKFALKHQVEKGLFRRLVHFQLDNHNPNTDLWPWGREPIYRNGKFVGMTTSSGYGFTLERVVCLGFVHCFDEKSQEPQVVTNDYISKDARYEIQIAGKTFPARASLHPPKIPVVTMTGTNIRYVPKARAKV